MPARRGRVAVSITAENSGLKKGLRQSEGLVSKSERRIADSAKGAAAALGVGFGVEKLVEFGKSAVETASGISESLSKNRVLFGQYAKDVDAFTKTSADSFGISRDAALEATGTFGNLFKAVNVAPKQAANLSVSLTKLAADMASFNNASPEDALEAIRSGLVGETEPLRRFGVNIQDATLRQQAMSMGLTHTTKNVLTPYQKALAAQALIVKQTAAAHGDFKRTSSGLANQQRILKAEFSDLSAEAGKALLPALTNVTHAATEFIKGIRSGTGAGGRFADKMREIADRVKPVAKFFTDHPKIIALAVGAWVAYRVAAAAAMAATRLKALGMFKGLARPAAVEGTKAGTAFGTAASTAGGAAMRKGGWAGVGAALGTAIGTAATVAFVGEISVGIAQWLKKQPWYKPPGGKNSFFDDLIPDSFFPKKKPTKPKAPNRSQQDPFRPSTPLGTLPSGASQAPDNRPRAHTSSVRTFAASATSRAAPVASAARGPGRISGASSDKRRRALALMQSAWEAAAPYYGRAGQPMPRVKFTGGNSPLVGTVWNSDKTKVGSAVVYWPDWMTDWLLGLGKPGDRDAAFSTLIHEWAHIFQVTGLGEDSAEGGAQAFARRVAPKVAGAIGLSYSNVPFKGEQYQGPISRVKKQRGTSFIMSGQFRGGGAATATAARTSVRAAPTARAATARRRYSASQLAALWVQAGGDPKVADLMAAVALAESGGDSGIVNSIGASGLWQIHPPEPGVLDPMTNARIAVRKYKTQGLGAWEAYTNGSYRQFLGRSGGASRLTSTTVASTPTSRPKITTVGLERGQSGVSKGLGGRALPKGSAHGFLSALRPSDPQGQARLMRLFQIGNRRNKILADINSGRVKTPGTLQRLAGELADLDSEKAGLLGTDVTGLDAIPGASTYLGSLDRAGAEAALTPDTADDADVARRVVAARQAIYDYEKARPGQFSDADVADAARELKSARDAAADNTPVADNTDAIKALTDELKRTNDVNEHILGVTSGQWQRAFADIVSGQIAGVDYAGRRATAGDGRLANY